MLNAARDRFAACLAETLKWEGGYSNDPHDRGGPTMRGVIQVVYDGYRDSRGLPRRHVRQIEPDELYFIYRNNYWNMVRGDDLPAGVDLAVFDFGVNSGPTRAIKYLQRVLRIEVDGHIGAATLAAVARAQPEDLVRGLMAERRAFIRQIGTYWRFGKGWESRCNGVERAALLLAGQGFWNVEVPPAAPLANADDQSAQQGRAEADDPKPPIGTEIMLGTGGTAGIPMAASSAIARSTVGGKFSVTAFCLALLAEPLFWIAMVALWGSLAAFLYRRRHPI